MVSALKMRKRVAGKPEQLPGSLGTGRPRACQNCQAFWLQRNPWGRIAMFGQRCFAHVAVPADRHQHLEALLGKGGPTDLDCLLGAGRSTQRFIHQSTQQCGRCRHFGHKLQPGSQKQPLAPQREVQSPTPIRSLLHQLSARPHERMTLRSPFVGWLSNVGPRP